MKCTTRATFIVIVNEFADDKNPGNDARAGHARVVYKLKLSSAHAISTSSLGWYVRSRGQGNQLHYRNDAGDLWVRILSWKSVLLAPFQSSPLDDQLIHFWWWQGTKYRHLVFVLSDLASCRSDTDCGTPKQCRILSYLITGPRSHCYPWSFRSCLVNQLWCAQSQVTKHFASALYLIFELTLWIQCLQWHSFKVHQAVSLRPYVRSSSSASAMSFGATELCQAVSFVDICAPHIWSGHNGAGCSTVALTAECPFD